MDQKGLISRAIIAFPLIALTFSQFAIADPVFEDGFEQIGNIDPVAIDDEASVDQGQSIDIDVLNNDSDGDGEGFVVFSVTQPTNGQVINNVFDITYVHDGSATISDSFDYTIRDFHAGMDSATVNVTINPVATTQPNILFLIGDDMGIDTVSPMYPGLLENIHAIYDDDRVLGNPASTPNLLQIANQGIVFSSAWAQPSCASSRATLITGLYSAKTDVLAPGNTLPDDPTITFVDLLDDAGWNTALFGKWHLGTNSSGVLPQETGFDLFMGHTGPALENYWTYEYHVQDETTVNPSTHRTEPAPTKELPGISATSYAPVVKAADAIETITVWETSDPDTPWMVWMSFNEPHTPLHVPNADVMDTASFNEVTACGGVPGTDNTGSCSNAGLVRAMINAMDTVVGHILDTVENLDPNTYVIFIGDNGTTPRSIDNMYLTTDGRGKRTAYESGARVPLSITGPGINAGTQSNEFVHQADLFATTLELAGLEAPATNFDSNGSPVPTDSKSLVPILLGSESSIRDSDQDHIVIEVDTINLNHFGAARNGTFKVLCTDSLSNCVFFNLVTDPLEEFPLDIPADCTNYTTIWSTADPEWHYCKLHAALDSETLF